MLKHYKDELNDVIDYVELSKQMIDSLSKSILIDIAKEELEHATMLQHLMEKSGEWNPDSTITSLKQQADEALKSV